ncbi:MAG: helix-turn-helix domain-containing protein [Clostridia bacterium]|nr:helix-turn-helix domain-containing protein [Clostridia bacterium]
MIRLFELRTEKGLSQRELARLMNVSQGTYNNWENSNTQPSIEQQIALANFFEVSVDYLIGRTDEVGALIENSAQRCDKEIIRLLKTADKEIREAILTILKNL